MPDASSSPATIAALASGQGRAGVAVIRVSGPAVRAITEALFGRVPRPRHAVYRAVRAQTGEVLDYALALFFAAPASFTGEDVLEIQGHGSPVLADRILERLMELGARLAEAGEFSRRAFENNRLSLDQAEAIADAIAAESAAGATAAMRSLDGEFARRVESLTNALIRLRAWIEGALDFPDEDDVEWLDRERVQAELDRLRGEMAGLSSEAGQGARLRDGLRIAILGRPNAGKSSLLNALSRRDTAIVTEIPGTTRDVLDAQVNLAGLPVTLVDTAGLRDSDDPIEIEGVRRAQEAVHRANHILYVFDASAGLDPRDSAYLAELPTALNATLVANKIDLTPLPAGRTQAPDETNTAAIALSATSGHGLDALIAHLTDDLARGAVQAAPFSARRRHLDALARAEHSLSYAASINTDAGAPELIADELAGVQTCLGEITGAVSRDALLGEIFAAFCIGK